MSKDLLHYLALSQVPYIGVSHIKKLLKYFNTAENVFKAHKRALSTVEGIGDIRASSIKSWNQWKEIEKEITFCEKHHICILTILDEAYPKRLLHCIDAPPVIFFKGNANLNTNKIVSIVGTRTPTEYGKQMTIKIIKELSACQPIIISGLAYGIDIIAHKQALQQHIPTIAVLGHGLKTIYPFMHTSIAKDMIAKGGLITEHLSDIGVSPHHFPKRNRIVAGMCDVVVIIETAIKGGSMITAELAYSYNRDVFALPGRLIDPKSMGCISLIQQQKAIPFTSVTNLLDELGWSDKQITPTSKQGKLFLDLSPDEQKVVNILQENKALPIDTIYLQSQLSSSKLASALLQLEMNNVIISLPGKIYQLC